MVCTRQEQHQIIKLNRSPSDSCRHNSVYNNTIDASKREEGEEGEEGEEEEGKGGRLWKVSE